MFKFKTLTLFYFVIIFLVSCKSDNDKNKVPEKKATPLSKVDAIVVTAQTLSQNIEMPGSIIAYEETEIHPEVSGRVTAIYFKEGGNTTQGNLLVKLYDDDLQAQLKKLEVQLKVAQKTVERFAGLLKINGVSQQEYDLNVLAVNNIKADINIIKTNINRTVIKAPFSGRIGLRNISIGAYVTPQTVICTLSKVNQLKIEFTVPEKYATKMKEGSVVNFNIENNNNKYFAKIMATENNIIAETRSLKVKAIVDKIDAKLIAGAFINVQIPLDKNNQALMIPTQAIIPKARNKEVMLYYNGSVINQTVTTGIRDSSFVEIITGLKAGDTILISGLLTTKPGAKVLLNNIIKP